MRKDLSSRILYMKLSVAFVAFLCMLPAAAAGAGSALQGKLISEQFEKLSTQEIRSYGWQLGAMMREEDNGRLNLCGGIIVSKSWVLTSLHCVYKKINDKSRASSLVPFTKNELSQNHLYFIPHRLTHSPRRHIVDVIVARAFDNQKNSPHFLDWALAKVDKDINLRAYPKFSLSKVDHDYEYFVAGYPLVVDSQGDMDWAQYYVPKRTRKNCDLTNYVPPSKRVAYKLAYSCFSHKIGPGLSGSPLFRVETNQNVVVGMHAGYGNDGLTKEVVLLMQIITPELLALINQIQAGEL